MSKELFQANEAKVGMECELQNLLGSQLADGCFDPKNSSKRHHLPDCNFS